MLGYRDAGYPDINFIDKRVDAFDVEKFSLPLELPLAIPGFVISNS